MICNDSQTCISVFSFKQNQKENVGEVIPHKNTATGISPIFWIVGLYGIAREGTCLRLPIKTKLDQFHKANLHLVLWNLTRQLMAKTGNNAWSFPSRKRDLNTWMRHYQYIINYYTQTKINNYQSSNTAIVCKCDYIHVAL